MRRNRKAKEEREAFGTWPAQNSFPARGSQTNSNVFFGVRDYPKPCALP